jgi:hypothetical protein
VAKPEYQYGRMGLAINGDVLFYPKVRVLKSGVRQAVGKKLKIEEGYQAFLNAGMSLAAQEGIRVKVSLTFPKKKKVKRG